MSPSINRKVMIVDDERDVTDLFEGILCDHFTVIKAYSGEDALSKLEVDKPDLILLDIQMPGMNGWEALDKIKQGNGMRDILFIMLTAVKPDFNILEKGIENYLVKPVGQKQLINAIQETFNTRDKIEKFGETALSQGIKRELIEEYKEKAKRLESNERLLLLLKQIYTRQALADADGLSEGTKNMLGSMENALKLQKVQLYSLMADIQIKT